MDRQEQNFEARTGRLERNAGYRQHGAYRDRSQERGQPNAMGDAHQSEGLGQQQGNEGTPTGERWAQSDSNSGNDGTSMDGVKKGDF